MNVGRLSLDNLERFGEHTALHFGDRSFTNRERLEHAASLAAVLESRGVRAGDHVLVMMANSPDVTAAFQAVWKLGAVIVPVTPQLAAREVRHLLEDSEARTVITSPQLAPVLAEASSGGPDRAGNRADLLVLGATDTPDAVDVSALVAQAKGALPIDRLANRSAGDLALLLYTSGTTGHPKGVMLSHGNLGSNVESLASMDPDLEPFQRSLLVLPLSHSFGVMTMNVGLRVGIVSALLPRFEATAVLDSIQRHRIQRISVVPTMLTYLLHHPRRAEYDTSTLERVHSGGAALPDEIRRAFERAFGCRVKEGYGMSESAPTATGYRPDEPYRPGSVGRAIPGVRVSVRNDADQEVPRGVWGEICIQGPNVMRGYWKLPEATAEALRGGWLRSGDVGYMDEEGYVFLTDRKKDLIIKGGENISPREVEEAIHQHPAVAEVAVVGVPHSTYGEDLCAVVALKPGAAADAEELRAHTTGLLTKFKVPSRFVFIDELPKSANAKILKRELRDRLAQAAVS
jgi:long-chain acyl-CoA synthetase